MKKIKTIIVVSLLAISMVGCGNSTEKKAIEQGKLAMGSKEYNKALASFQLAVDEGSKDEEILKISEIIEKYNEANNIFKEGKIEEAKKIADEINEEYKNYAIKDDIETLKKSIEDKYKVAQEIKSEIDKLSTLVEEKKYDEANNVISSLEGKELTEEQINRVSEMKNKIKENKNELVANSQSKKDEYLKKLKRIEDEVSKISYDGDTLQMKEASSKIFKKWDDILNEIYGVLKSQLSSSEMESLKEEQRQWIAIRDAGAEESASEFEGGTMYGLEYTEALSRQTQQRCYDLVNTYMK
ncbi:MAG: lysozyme inhibitor LprI family protein [Peptostreptococcaceae bacterium]